MNAPSTSQIVGSAKMKRPLHGSFSSGVSILGMNRLARSAAVAAAQT